MGNFQKNHCIRKRFLIQAFMLVAAVLVVVIAVIAAAAAVAVAVVAVNFEVALTVSYLMLRL